MHGSGGRGSANETMSSKEKAAHALIFGFIFTLLSLFISSYGPDWAVKGAPLGFVVIEAAWRPPLGIQVKPAFGLLNVLFHTGFAFLAWSIFCRARLAGRQALFLGLLLVGVVTTILASLSNFLSPGTWNTPHTAEQWRYAQIAFAILYVGSLIASVLVGWWVAILLKRMLIYSSRRDKTFRETR